uniref:High mobility group protein B2 n=1 Tax=Amphiprion ocellaris TaxID=80972 RepID=A0A3Q1B3S6_AMPOC
MRKDPNKPRGKTSSYAFFVATCREEHKKKHPGTSVSFSEFSKKCSERWKTMSPKEKVKFEDMAKNDKVRYDREMKSYIPPKGAKKGKKKKDPNAPKRPPSAFFVFCSDHRSTIKEENPGISIGDIAKKLGELWAKAAKLKEKYEKDVAAYRAKGGSGKSDAGKKSGPGRPAAKKAEPADDDDDDEEDDDEDDDDEDDDDEDDD